jgi:hypothetical protein
VNTRTRTSTIGLTLALAAASIAPATAQAAAPTCNDMNVGVPHNAATPIFVDCTGGSGTGSPDVRITEDPTKGTLSVASPNTSTDQWVLYTPNAGASGADSFTYRGVSPGSGVLGVDELTGERIVDLRIAPGTPPVCSSLSQSVPQAIATNLRLVCASGGDPITSYAISDAVDHGTLGTTSLNSGLVAYTSTAGFAGADVFKYRATSTCGAAACQSAEAIFDLMVLDPQQGPEGPKGDPGADGTDGTNGATGPTGATGAQGPQGATGPTGPAGSTGAAGPAGLNGANGKDGAPGAVVSTPRLLVASFLDALSARSGKAVVLRYVSTTDARVILEVFKGKRRVASVPGRAREGRNTIRWNGKSGSKAATSGAYRLVLRATSGGQVASDAATVRIAGRSGKPSTGGGTPPSSGGGGGTPPGGGGGGVGEG